MGNWLSISETGSNLTGEDFFSRMVERSNLRGFLDSGKSLTGSGTYNTNLTMFTNIPLAKWPLAACTVLGIKGEPEPDLPRVGLRSFSCPLREWSLLQHLRQELGGPPGGKDPEHSNTGMVCARV